MHIYLGFIKLVRVLLTLPHDTALHGVKNPLLSSLEEGQERPLQLEIVPFQKVLLHGTIFGDSTIFLVHQVELVVSRMPFRELGDFKRLIQYAYTWINY